MMNSRTTILQSAYTGLDPMVDGFQGAIVELSSVNGVYVVRKIAVGTGNSLLSFRSVNTRRARALFEELLYHGTTDTATAGDII